MQQEELDAVTVTTNGSALRKDKSAPVHVDVLPQSYRRAQHGIALVAGEGCAAPRTRLYRLNDAPVFSGRGRGKSA